MRYLTVVLFTGLIISPGFAQSSKQYRVCSKKAMTQQEMNACASQEAARVDAELNVVYRALLSKAANNPEAVPKIKALQRALIAYRDAYMDAMYPAADKQAEYGTVYPLEVDLLRAKLTRQQIAAVRELLKQYGDEAQRREGIGEGVELVANLGRD